MKIYFAGGPHSTSEQLRSYGVKYKLYSYANDQRAIANWGNEGLMLDSGAFSVFTGKAKVDIKRHTEFVANLKPEQAIQLDVIGNDDATWKNYLYQREIVPDILPVIHHNASDKHIKRVVDTADYVLLGGLVPLTRRRKVMFAWLDYLYSKYKLHEKKVHLLGVTTPDVLKRYPAYSVDSTSWLSPSRYPVEGRNTLFIKQKQKDYRAMEQITIKKTIQLEKDITRLWENRGIKWN